MMKLPGGWQDERSSCTSAAAGAATRAGSAPAIPAQRCVAVTGGRALTTERRSAARTQLGMPALALPTSQAPPSAGQGAPTASTAIVLGSPARRGPPPLPAHLAVPKVLVSATPLLADTVRAQRLQLQDVTCELATAGLLPSSPRRPSAPARVADSSAVWRATAPRGVRGLMATVLVWLLSLLAPSPQSPPAPRADHDARPRRRR